MKNKIKLTSFLTIILSLLFTFNIFARSFGGFHSGSFSSSHSSFHSSSTHSSGISHFSTKSITHATVRGGYKSGSFKSSTPTKKTTINTHKTIIHHNTVVHHKTVIHHHVIVHHYSTYHTHYYSHSGFWDNYFLYRLLTHNSYSPSTYYHYSIGQVFLNIFSTIVVVTIVIGIIVFIKRKINKR